MPELPEVEVTRRSFADAIAGATVRAGAIGKTFALALGCAGPGAGSAVSCKVCAAVASTSCWTWMVACC